MAKIRIKPNEFQELLLEKMWQGIDLETKEFCLLFNLSQIPELEGKISRRANRFLRLGSERMRQFGGDTMAFYSVQSLTGIFEVRKEWNYPLIWDAQRNWAIKICKYYTSKLSSRESQELFAISMFRTIYFIYGEDFIVNALGHNSNFYPTTLGSLEIAAQMFYEIVNSIERKRTKELVEIIRLNISKKHFTFETLLELFGQELVCDPPTLNGVLCFPDYYVNWQAHKNQLSDLSMATKITLFGAAFEEKS